jgi:hypothetical protein
MDSVMSKILLMSVAVDSGLTMIDLNRKTAGFYRAFANLDAMADFAFNEAQRIGNSLEQASVLTIMCSLAESRGDIAIAAQCQQQAMDIYKKQNRPDMCRQLRRKFEPTGGKLIAGIFV